MKTQLALIALPLTLILASAALADAETEIKTACASEWPGDYRMQKYCFDEQRKAIAGLAVLAEQAKSETVLKQIIAKCMSEWPGQTGGFDWRMVKYCSDEQIEAYRELNR